MMRQPQNLQACGYQASPSIEAGWMLTMNSN